MASPGSALREALGAASPTYREVEVVEDDPRTDYEQARDLYGSNAAIAAAMGYTRSRPGTKARRAYDTAMRRLQREAKGAAPKTSQVRRLRRVVRRRIAERIPGPVAAAQEAERQGLTMGGLEGDIRVSEDRRYRRLGLDVQVSGAALREAGFAELVAAGRDTEAWAALEAEWRKGYPMPGDAQWSSLEGLDIVLGHP